MASTYSTNLGIELIGTGDQSGTWGATTNTNFGTLVEQAIVGYSTQAVTDSGTATVLTIANGASSTGRNYVIELTGALTAARTVTVPAVNKPYTFFNNTTGGFAVTVKVSGQTGVIIANGKKAIVYTNTTDVIEVANAPATEAGTQTLTNKTLTSPLIGTVIGGTTAASSLTLQSTSGVGTTDSILFKVGNNGATTAITVSTAGLVTANSFGSSSVALTGGTINGTTIGATTATTGIFTTATATTITSPASTALTIKSAGTTAMTVDTSQNVGIGTTSPSRKLDIEQIGTDYQMRMGDTGNYYDIGRNTGNGLLTFYGSQAVASGYVFSTVNGERMRIDTLGNVGIGTSSPGAKLDVNGTAYLRSTVYLGSSVTQNIAADSTTLYLRGTAVAFQDAPATTTKMYIDSSGNVGIGNSNASVKLLVRGAGSSSAAYAFLVEDSSGTTLQYVRNDGYFTTGVGSFSPYNYTTGFAANVFIDGNGGLLRSTSSLRYKNSIQDATYGLGDVLKLRAVTYKSNNDGDRVFGGFIAEEVDAAGLKEFVSYDKEGQPDALHYANMAALMAKAIQELSAKNDALEARLAKLENAQ
jgi:hypothetical protein